MQHEGKGESGEMSSPEVHDSMPHSDMAQFTVQGIADALNTVEITVTESPFWHKMLHGRVLYSGPHCALSRHTQTLELVHVDFTSIKMAMAHNKPPSVKNVLVLTDHFTRYAMAFITKDQKAKTVTHILYEQFIAVFGTPKLLLSDRSANFTSALVEELGSAFGIQRCGTATCHAQCNGQAERFHQTLFRMIRKLATDNKAQWEHHLSGLMQAYNNTRSVVTGYSPHYLMHGRWPRLHVDLFPLW